MNDLINKFLGMNAETRGRTVAAIVVYILNLLVTFNIIEFSNEQIDSIAQVAVLCATAVAWVLSHYKNNDFTEEALIGTGITRQLKLEKEASYVGERFFNDESYEDEDEIYEEEEEDEQDFIQTV